MTVVEATARSTGSPADVWAQLADLDAWPRWGAWSEATGSHEVGGVRQLHARPFRVRERITALEPERRFAYELVHGMDLEGYRGEITLEPDGDGTLVRWRSTWERGSRLHGLVVRLAVRDACRRVARAASR